MLGPQYVNGTAVDSSRAGALRMRPRLHFTASQGWTNDPHGLIHFGGEYHMFFQYNPAGVVWDKACHWGHATSADLITWTERAVALAPVEEIGCWSGSAVVDGDEVVILYTTIRHEDFSRGAVAVARSRGDLSNWQRHQGPDVITGPPLDLNVQGFRDPFVWKAGSEWKALLGAGVPGLGGTALQYSSPDLVRWTFDGPIAQGSAFVTDPVWTGSVWECPQLFEVDGRWVLLVSAWDADVVHHVAYAIGDYDGARFSAERWGRLTHGTIAYATSFFRDANGLPVVMSWLRESGNVAPPNSPWASAVSLPFVLAIVEEDLQLRHHDALRCKFDTTQSISVGGNLVESSFFLVTVIGTMAGAAVELQSEVGSLTVTVEQDGLYLRDRDGIDVLRLPRSREVVREEVEVSVDADIVEVTWNGCSGIGSARIAASERYTIRALGAARQLHAELHTSK